jgi:hypothetical protein
VLTGDSSYSSGLVIGDEGYSLAKNEHSSHSSILICQQVSGQTQIFQGSFRCSHFVVVLSLGGLSLWKGETFFSNPEKG